MSSVTLTKEILKDPKRRSNRLRSGYKIDFWREVTKRWLVLGVLCSVLLAVITPKIGAPGGFLHTEYTVYLPLTYIYYNAGRSRVSFSHVSRRACAIGIAHAHLVAPALAISLSQAIVERDSVNRGLLTGIILSSIGGPCGWLSLSVCVGASERARAAAILACNYVTSLVAEPLFIFILCGRFTHPPLIPTLFSVTLTTGAFCLGAYHQRSTTQAMSLANHIFSSENHVISSVNHINSSAYHAMSSTNDITSPTHDVISSSDHITSSGNHACSSSDHITSNHAISSNNHTILNNGSMIPSTMTPSQNNTTHQITSCLNHVLPSNKRVTSSTIHKFSVNNKMSSANHTVPLFHSMSSSKRVKCCALAALYVECCTRLREAEGELYVTHVLATLILVLGWLCLNALFCCVYYRSGLLSYEETNSVALCSVPKCLDVGWEFGTLCVPTGLSLLPAAFLAPSQALLLAAASRPDNDEA